MNEATRQAIREAAELEVASWPELTEEQKDELRRLLACATPAKQAHWRAA